MNIIKAIITLLILEIGIGSLGICPIKTILYKVNDRVRVVVTAYSSTFDQTDRTPFEAASGRRPRLGIIAVSRDLKKLLNFGQWVYLEGIGYFIVEDVMHTRWTERVDIWFPTRREAWQFGIKTTMLRWDKKIISLKGIE